MQYRETLPLRDHEVVLTFDDGPLPHNSDQVLAILAAQCIKANFFLIGKMAQSFPEGVRKLRDAGHTIGTHSQDHPLTMNKMPIERAKAEIDDGIASVKAALGPDADKSLAPFFRIPGLLRAEAVEDYLASRASRPGARISRPTTGAIFRRSGSTISRSSASRPKARAFCCCTTSRRAPSRRCRGSCATLKARGYHIVHVVPATPDRPATPTEPQEWQLHPMSENVATTRWPKIPQFHFRRRRPVGRTGFLLFRPVRRGTVAVRPMHRLAACARCSAAQAPWPRDWVTPGNRHDPAPSPCLHRPSSSCRNCRI